MLLDELRAEHAAVRELLGLLADPARRSEALAGLARRLPGHFEREERDLLPLLSGLLPQRTGPIQVILEEHARIREMLGPSGADPERLLSLVESHLAKEEEVLFPFAEDRLGGGEP